MWSEYGGNGGRAAGSGPDGGRLLCRDEDAVAVGCLELEHDTPREGSEREVGAGAGLERAPVDEVGGNDVFDRHTERLEDGDLVG